MVDSSSVPSPVVSPPAPGQARGVSYLYMAAAFVIVVAGMRAAESILNPLLLAVFLSIVSAPAYFGLLNRKVSEWLALLTVIGVLGLILFGVVLIVTKSIAGFMSEQEHYQERLREEKDRIVAKVETWVPDWAKKDKAIPVANEPVQSGALESNAVKAPSFGGADDGQPAVGGTSVKEQSEKARSNAAVSPESKPSPSVVATEERFASENPDGAETLKLAALGVKAEGSEVHPGSGPKVSLPSSEWLRMDNTSRPLPKDEQGWQEYMSEQFSPGTAIAFAASVAGSLGQLLSNAFLILLMVIFILLEAGTLDRKMRKAFSQTVEASDRGREIVKSLQHYIVIKTWISLGTGILVAVWLNFFGVSHAPLWGLLAFLFNFIPNIGSIIAAVPALLVAWLDVGIQPAIACAIGFALVNGVIGNFIEPRVMGKGLGLSAMVVFCSMLFWGWVLGPVGMLLSVPLTMTARIVMNGFDDTRWIATLLGNAD